MHDDVTVQQSEQRRSRQTSVPGRDETVLAAVGAGDARALVVSLLKLALRDVALDLDVDLLRSHSVRVGLRLSVVDVLEVGDRLELECTRAEGLKVVERGNCAGCRQRETITLRVRYGD